MITSLHHVTATVSNAQEDLDFHSGVLGLRLLKRTINFDQPNVYHLYYGNEVGAPSTIMTTFPYEGFGMRRGTRGTGQITEVSYSAPSGSLDSWRGLLEDREVSWEDRTTAFGEASLRLNDSSGLDIRLIESADDERPRWVDGRFGDEALHGIHHVTLSVRTPGRSLEFLTGVLDFEIEETEGSWTRLAVGEKGPGRIVEVEHLPEGTAASGGTGSVHHVAFSVPGPDEQLAYQERLRSMGWPVTEVRDRQYFQSIYFPEPGGALFEIATAGPGFAIDEPADGLGKELKLPPWEESNRASIEAQLPPLRQRARP